MTTTLLLAAATFAQMKTFALANGIECPVGTSADTLRAKIAEAFPDLTHIALDGTPPVTEPAPTTTAGVQDATEAETESAVDEDDGFVTMTFPGLPSDTAVKGCLNGDSFEYKRGEEVRVRKEHLEVIEGFGLAPELSSSEALPEGEDEEAAASTQQ